jgi:hypothetical protein
MKLLKRTAILFSVILFFATCSKSDTPSADCQNDASKRRGARCKDGTESTATGSGACSNHGGVDYWLCK